MSSTLQRCILPHSQSTGSGNRNHSQTCLPSPTASPPPPTAIKNDRRDSTRLTRHGGASQPTNQPNQPTNSASQQNPIIRSVLVADQDQDQGRGAAYAPQRSTSLVGPSHPVSRSSGSAEEERAAHEAPLFSCFSWVTLLCNYLLHIIECWVDGVSIRKVVVVVVAPMSSTRYFANRNPVNTHSLKGCRYTYGQVVV